jgi:acetoin utilization protein AcuB
MSTEKVTVSHIMTADVVTVEMDDTLHAVREIFENTCFHHLLVVNDQRLLSVISDRDLLKALSLHLGTAAETLRDLASLNKKVHQIMSRYPIALSPNAGIYDAVSVFNAEKISCIPIVDEEQRVKGILTWRDILHALEKNRKHRCFSNNGFALNNPSDRYTMASSLLRRIMACYWPRIGLHLSLYLYRLPSSCLINTII